MTDPTVPMHWKLYALINGFWIAGKPVFASNAFFAEKLGCSERYVRDCLSKLEEIGVVLREGKSQNRRIVPAARVEEGGTGSSAQGGTSGSVREEPAVPHISVSNSVIKNTAKAVPSFSVVSDSPESRSPKKDTGVLRLRDSLYDMFEKEYGVYPTISMADYKRVQAALKHLTEKQVIDLVEDALEGNRPPKTVREALTDRAIDTYRYEHA